ncbi:MAG: formylglycine-generating enzyme family protein [Bacteroidetes bacterium]|jgi:sulfatase modifying factor 1|nr:formylglycine-generating enzyme family protein [Bacteroidota bacterium]MBK7041222.1 formylglycine-generating enzyme family protein [Bacteroidota bacterium]MBK8328708.1 formylglycine-generating enzyme family protein [Bacteroidota bacterium]MBK9302019.1 formylglycine-generating enzyme family protein [Bacteroidota bacterium]MBK9481586.1 formylglycine-generating enzyme family protein [Bacteroidota bacterium]
MRTIFIILFLFNSRLVISQGQSSMVNIKGGVFLPLYSLDSQKTEVKPFLMDVYPVTNADYKKFILQNSSWRKSKIKPIYADTNYLHQWNSDTSFAVNLALSPVVNISWFAAKKYCECQGKRLPTVAEWELAGRASETKPDATKDLKFNQWILNWVSKTSPKVLPNVGSTFKNYYGVWDLHGLVWEWTFDFNSALTTGESRGNSGLDNTFFCGGGSFASKDINNYASFMRFASRSSVKAKYGVPNLGFRCVKSKL